MERNWEKVRIEVWKKRDGAKLLLFHKEAWEEIIVLALKTLQYYLKKSDFLFVRGKLPVAW